MSRAKCSEFIEPEQNHPDNKERKKKAFMTMLSFLPELVVQSISVSTLQTHYCSIHNYIDWLQKQATYFSTHWVWEILIISQMRTSQKRLKSYTIMYAA